jgi:putative transposase
MTSIIEVRKSYKYRLYASRHDFRLHDTVNIAGIVWNHITALQRRYYRLFKKHISESRMKNYTAYLRMKTKKYAYWRQVGSQAVQELCERHEAAYQRFFQKKGGLPRFKKVKKFRSFVLKQSGWKLGEDSHKRGGEKHPK